MVVARGGDASQWPPRGSQKPGSNNQPGSRGGSGKQW